MEPLNCLSTPRGNLTSVWLPRNQKGVESAGRILPPLEQRFLSGSLSKDHKQPFCCLHLLHSCHSRERVNCYHKSANTELQWIEETTTRLRIQQQEKMLTKLLGQAPNRIEEGDNNFNKMIWIQRHWKYSIF